MHSDKQVIRDLVRICGVKGIREAIICPGSRNAPLTIELDEHPEIKCYSIVDERSAGFYALGMAQQLKRPVVLACTSGSAAINFAPAIVEAYYQKIPLLVLTADRPPEWIDQADGQTIDQYRVFSNYIKKSYTLPVEPQHADEIWHAQRIMSEAIENTRYPENGPIHVNIPLREPLYNQIEKSEDKEPKIFQTVSASLSLSSESIGEFQQHWKEAKRILIITGVMHPSEELNRSLKTISQQEKVAILTETTSNLYGEEYCNSIDRIMVAIEDQESSEYVPDLLITCGGSVVSKKVKAYFRKHRPAQHWHINASNDYWDTYQSLTQIVPISPEQFFVHFEGLEKEKSAFRDLWKKDDLKYREVFHDYLSTLPFSDLKVFERVLEKLPEGSQLQLANSTPVRYSNLFNKISERRIHTYCNRGTSGIDGTVSTAGGASIANDCPVTVITGDMSFFYDSNALWNNYIQGNFHIILINNGGGNIFRIIPGPSRTGQLETFFETRHDLRAEGLASTFGVDYYYCEDMEGLEKGLNWLYLEKRDRPSLLEVHTANSDNAGILHAYFGRLKKG